MALATVPFQASQVTVTTAGTSQAVSLNENCHTVSVTNPSSTATIFAAWGTASGTLSLTNAIGILPGARETIPIGSRSQRASGGSGTLYLDASANGSVAYIVQYNGNMG